MGYRHGGLEILLDKDTVRPGATVPVLVSVPTPDRWVLFSAEADELHRLEVLHVTGTVKLVELKVDDAYVPNIFLQGSMVRDQQLFQDTKQLVVPPTEHYLSVSVEPDKHEHQARDSGTWTVTTRDANGHGVAAEVAVGVVDDSVYAIQSELAGDPRQFYFGTKRGQALGMQTTFNQKAYAKVLPTPTAPPANPEIQAGFGTRSAGGTRTRASAAMTWKRRPRDGRPAGDVGPRGVRRRADELAPPKASTAYKQEGDGPARVTGLPHQRLLPPAPHAAGVTGEPAVVVRSV